MFERILRGNWGPGRSWEVLGGPRRSKEGLGGPRNPILLLKPGGSGGPSRGGPQEGEEKEL